MLNNNVQKVNVKAMCKKRMYNKYVNTVSVADPDHFYRIRTISTGSGPVLPDPTFTKLVPDPFSTVNSKHYIFLLLYSLQYSIVLFCVCLFVCVLFVCFVWEKKLEPATSRLKNENISG